MMLKFKQSKLVVLFLFLLVTGSAYSQRIETPAPSPSAKLTQTVGLVDVTVDYSRPGKKGRDIFGALVPFGQIWRTGANAATKITFSDDVKLEGKEVKAGTYAIYSMPGKSSWTIMIYKDLSIGGNVAAYDKSNELTRFTVNPMNNSWAVESFTIDINDMTDKSATIKLMWDKTIVPIKITVDTDASVIGQIERFAENPEAALAGNYFSSASYYLGIKKDLDKALVWIDKAVQIRPEAFWMIRTKSLIQAELGKYKEAIKTAEQSKKVAQAANNSDYVRLNNNSIAEWKKK